MRSAEISPWSISSWGTEVHLLVLLGDQASTPVSHLQTRAAGAILKGKTLFLSMEISSAHSSGCCLQVHPKNERLPHASPNLPPGRNHSCDSRTSVKVAGARYKVFSFMDSHPFPGGFLPLHLPSCDASITALLLRALWVSLAACFLLWLLSKASLLPGWS